MYVHHIHIIRICIGLNMMFTDYFGRDVWLLHDTRFRDFFPGLFIKYLRVIHRNVIAGH